MIQVRSVSALSDGEVGVICAEGINRLIGLLGGVETNISYQQLTNVLYFNSSIGELLTSSAAVDLTFEQVQSYIVYCTAVELVVERVPAMITNTTYIKERIVQLRNQGIDIRVLMVD